MPLTSTVGRRQFINIRPIDPRTEQTGLRWETDPIHDYRVTFWRRGASSEFDLSGAADVHEALEWAEEEALARESTYTLFASVDRGPDRGLVWLAGVETRLSGRVRTSNYADGSSVVTTGGSVLVAFLAPFNPVGRRRTSSPDTRSCRSRPPLGS
jgi:hypothetical protein